MSLVATPVGRWSGVLVASFHTPWRSGSPHGVRNPLGFAAGVADVAAGGVAAFVCGFAPALRVVCGVWLMSSDSDPTAITIAGMPRVATERRVMRRLPCNGSRRGPLDEAPV